MYLLLLVPLLFRLSGEGGLGLSPWENVMGQKGVAGGGWRGPSRCPAAR